MKKIPETISEQEFLDKLKDVKKKHIKLAFMLGFYQCMRVSEVVKLNLVDIDTSRGFVHIRQAKGGKDRQVPLMPPMSRIIKHLPVGIGPRALQKQIKKYWPRLHFHCLRHSGATMYLNEKGVDVRIIQVLLGHSRLDTTQIYTKVTPKNLSEVFNKVWE